jgi:EmrB/QacA subfamily drug resistance transporter
MGGAIAGHRRATWALVVICAAQLMVVVDVTIVNIALPSIQRDLGFSAAGLEWVVNAYALAFGGLLLLGGRAGDLYGRRRMFMVGIAVFSVASLLGGFSDSQAWMIGARAVQGAGGAVAAPTALALLADTFAEGPERNRAMGFYAAMSGAGGGVGLLLGGVLVQIASWRWVFFVNVPIGVAVLFLTPKVFDRSATRHGRLDLPGAVTVTAGMSLLVYGLSHAATTSWSATATWLSLTAAGVLLVAFVAIEAWSPHALLPLRILADRNRSGSDVVMLSLGAAVFATFFFITQFLQDVLGYSPLRAGVAFLPMALGITLAAGAAVGLIGRVGPQPLVVVGPLIVAGGLAWLSRITVHTAYPQVLGAMLMVAVGLGFAFVPLTLGAVSGVTEDDTGLASALLNAAQQLGGSLGLAVLVTVATTVTRGTVARLAAAARVHGTGGLPVRQFAQQLKDAAVTAGYRQAFVVAAGIAVGSFVIAVTVLRLEKPKERSLLPVGA